jgi:proline iminopeptidase
VSDIHEIYYEESGRKDGKPVIYLHGGPGGGCGELQRRFFDPAVYRIILMDQRGAGRSRPSSELRENTTWDLVSDLEKLRNHLGVEKWVLFGGSWGSTLALVYAETHPDRVTALVLRGIFTLRREELLWLYQEGASYIYPDEWEKFVEPIPVVERGDMMSAYYRRLTGDDKQEMMRCARAWSGWELLTSKLVTDVAQVQERMENDEFVLNFARIECHYFVHGGWFEDDNHVLNRVATIRHIPATIVQGRYDLITPMKTAWELHKLWPEAEFHVVPNAGHSQSELGTQTKLLDACDQYKTL